MRATASRSACRGRRAASTTRSSWPTATAGSRPCWSGPVGFARAHVRRDTIHPEDRRHWPAIEAEGPQRIELRLKQPDGEWRWHRLRAAPILRDDDSVEEWIGTIHDIHEQKLSLEHRELVIGELRHRLKNLLTVIDALAKNSRKADSEEQGVEIFLQRFLGRLHALGTAGDLVLAGDRVSVDADTLLRTTLSPFASDIHPASASRDRVCGSRKRPPAASASPSTNSPPTLSNMARLSAPAGRVELTWTVAPAEGGATRIAIQWKELGGPEPKAPEKPGFGTRMIKVVAAREKGSKAEIDYAPQGLICRIAFTLDARKENAPPT